MHAFITIYFFLPIPKPNPLANIPPTLNIALNTPDVKIESAVHKKLVKWRKSLASSYSRFGKSRTNKVTIGLDASPVMCDPIKFKPIASGEKTP
jgi:hypothetical protein